MNPLSIELIVRWERAKTLAVRADVELTPIGSVIRVWLKGERYNAIESALRYKNFFSIDTAVAYIEGLLTV